MMLVQNKTRSGLNDLDCACDTKSLSGRGQAEK